MNAEPNGSFGAVRRASHRAAFATTSTVLFVGAAMLLTVVALTNVSLTQISLSRRGQDKVAATQIAEAGVDDVIDQITRNQIPLLPKPNSGSLPPVTVTGTLYENAAAYASASTGPKTQAGTYSTTVVDYGSDDKEVRKRVTSVGKTANGAQATVYALVTVNLYSKIGAAIRSNGDIGIGGTANIGTSDTFHDANAQANGNITMQSGSSGVDGSLYATGSVGGVTSGSSQVVAVQSGVPPIFFLDAATLLNEQAYLKNLVINYPLNISNNQLNASTPTAPYIIQAPAYISSNLKLVNNQSIVILPPANSTTPSVVYVDGNVDLSGQSILTNGANLVVGGSFNQNGGTIYQVSPTTVTYPDGTTYTPSLGVFNNGASGSTAISLNGGGTNTNIGIVYAYFGNMVLSGGSTFTGSLTAAGQGATIKTTGNFTFTYPGGQATDIPNPSPPTVHLWAQQ